MSQLKPKKIKHIKVTTDAFLHELSNTESIFFEILTEKNENSSLCYGLHEKKVAQMAIDIDKYNETEPPAKIEYKIAEMNYDSAEDMGSEEILELDLLQKKMEQLFPSKKMFLSTKSGGSQILTTEQFKKLLELFKPYFYDFWSEQELIDTLYDSSK